MNWLRVSPLLMCCLLVLSPAGNAGNAEEVKSLSGISIIGNKDTPKSLYIVPWRSAELGMETDLSSSLLNEGVQPVDKDVFLRELNFYEISSVK